MKTFPRMKKRLLLLAALAALTWGAYAQEVKIGMVNDGTRRFLEEVDYSADTAYVVSYARDYRKNLGASDRPKPVTVTWKEGNAAKLVVSSSPLFAAVTEVPFEEGEARIYNLVPGVKYFYRVLDGDGKVLASAGFTPVGPLRMIAGVASNMRDLGGWKADGGHIAYGKLFRGAALSSRRTTERAKEIFLSIGVYFAHTVALYANYYDLKYLLVMGRVASGIGGDILIAECNRVLKEEYPALAAKVTVMLPDEKARRVGQSIAAASLPALPEK